MSEVYGIVVNDEQTFRDRYPRFIGSGKSHAHRVASVKMKSKEFRTALGLSLYRMKVDQMSALGGIYCYDGKALDPGILVSLGESLTLHGPDGGRDVSTNTVGFTFRAFHTNRESRLVDQPYITHDRLILAWDGRLDNREDLINILSDEFRSNHSSISDVQIQLAGGILQLGR